MRILFIVLSLVLLLIISAFVVPNFLSPFDLNGSENDILWHYRLPKTITAVFAGMCLSVSGFILQQLFRNNLAGPYILGVSSGASLAVGLVIIGSHYFPFLSSGFSLSMAGFAGASLILLMVMAVSTRYGTGAVILLFGVIIGQVSGALQGLLNYLAIPGDLKYFALWAMGSFSQVIEYDLITLAFASSVGFIWAFTMMPQLSVMILGDDVAKTLGVNTKRISIYLLFCTGILSGIATAYCGPIAFIGMAIPNASRLLIKSANFKTMLIINALLGAMMALISDIVSSIELFGLYVPINVCTALIGGPFILYILLKKRH